MTDNTSPTPSHPRFLIDRILRSHEVHLISGPSGSGKTTLLLQILESWSQGQPVFEHESAPLPFCLVSCDRAVAAIDDSMTRLGLDPAAVPHFSVVDPPARLFRRQESTSLHDDLSLSELIATCRHVSPTCALLLIDGFSTLCPGKIIDHRDVVKFLRDSSRLCKQYQITILGTVYATKSREGEGYSAPCDRILGAGAWASHTGTKFIIEPAGSKRALHILPQNSKPETYELMHDESGRLVPYVSSKAMDVMTEWLSLSVPADSILTTADVVAFAESAGISESTAKRWIAEQLEHGALLKVSRGEYRVRVVTVQ